jgi:hypothetical protein
MGINSALKAILHAAIPHPLAGYIRKADNATKLDVVVSESTGLEIVDSIDLGIKGADSPSVDAFGRWRVSEPANRIDVEFTYDAMPLIMETITAGGATITHNATTRDVTLAIVNATAGTSASFPSHYAAPYTPGNGQKIDMTGTLDYAGLGGGTTAVFVRNNGVEQVINQGSWNKDLLPDVDWSKSQIFAIDFQSLKTGRVRFGLVRNGIEITCHEIYNDNIRRNGYWQHPNLPLCWRIYNSGGNTVSEIGYFDADNGVGFRYTIPANAGAQMLAICGTVKSEGGLDLFTLTGFPFTASNVATTVTVSTILIPLVSIQLKATFNSKINRGLVIPTALSILSDNPLFYRLVLNPTLTGAAFASVDNNSLVNVDVAASALTGGTVIGAGYAGSGGNRAAPTPPGFTGRVPLSVDYAGAVGDILSVAAIRVGAQNAVAAAALEWKEIR